MARGHENPNGSTGPTSRPAAEKEANRLHPKAKRPSEAVTGAFLMRNVRRSLLRSRRDKADDEDLSGNVGGQARCELERQARIDRLKDGLGQRLSARTIHRLDIVDPRLAEDRTVAPKAQLDGDLVALMRRAPAGRDGRSDFRRKIDLAAPPFVTMIWSE